MAERLLGPTGSRRRRRWLGVPLALVMLVALFWITGAQAVHDDGLFELDRNTANGAAAGEDWDQVFANTDTAAASSFVTDGIGPTIFTGGGSKDDLNTTGWKHKNGSTPDKDELLHGYAARYGDNLYFGADRYDNSGDAVMGFWFFQNEVGPQAGGSFGPDSHEDGDILVLSDFTGGGGTVTIRVFQWNGPGGTIAGQGAIDGTLDLLAGTTASPADCIGPPSVPAGDPFCATVNTQSFSPAWAVQTKNGAANTLPAGHFYEGGIDLAFLDLENECFASFLAETRSSQSVDAVLKDFVGGSFQPCATTTTTTPSNASGTPLSSIVLGSSIYDKAVVSGSGTNVAPTGTVTFSLCSPSQLDSAGTLPNGDPDNPNTCDIGGTQIGSAKTLSPITGTTNSQAISDAATPNAIGTWCWRGVYSGDANYPPSTDSSTGECFTVTDIASTTTAQKWLPNDTATVTAQGGSAVAGTVVFSLYESANCSGTAVFTSTAIPVDSSGVAVSNNTTYYTTTKTISWRAVFTSTNSVASGPQSHCETMTVSTLNNDTGS